MKLKSAIVKETLSVGDAGDLFTNRQEAFGDRC